MKLLQVSDPAFTDEQWKAHYALLELLHERYSIMLPKTGWQQARDRALSLINADPHYHRFVVFDGSSAVGWGDFRVFAPGSDSECASVRFASAEPTPPDEFERLVAAEVLRLIGTYSVRSAHIMAEHEHVADMARRLNGNQLNQLTRFRLRRTVAQTERIQSWVERIPRSNPGLQMQFFSPVPEEYLEAHTTSFVRYIREMPTERNSATEFEFTIDDARRDIEWRRQNKTHLYTFALFNADRTMIGHTNGLISEDDPTDAYQAMTGVDRAYRGRGLSRWLKAALFLRIGEDFPGNQTMTTLMRAANAPIQKVNAEMGYELLSRGHEFDLTAEGLRAFLEG